MINPGRCYGSFIWAQTVFSWFFGSSQPQFSGKIKSSLWGGRGNGLTFLISVSYEKRQKLLYLRWLCISPETEWLSNHDNLIDLFYLPCWVDMSFKWMLVSIVQSFTACYWFFIFFFFIMKCNCRHWWVCKEKQGDYQEKLICTEQESEVGGNCIINNRFSYT